MWEIIPVENTDVTKLIYGEAPKGYKELYPAKPIEIGRIYSVHGEYYFRIIERNSKYIAEVFDYKEFCNKFTATTKAQ